MMAADFLLAKTQRRKQERLVTATGPRRTSTVTTVIILLRVREAQLRMTQQVLHTHIT